MRRTLSILLICFLIAGVAAPFIPIPATATSSGDLVMPGEDMTGVLTDDNPEDYWGVQLSVGTYNFSISSTNGSVNAYLYSYFNGWTILGELEDVYSNDSTMVTIYPGPINYLSSYPGEGEYQIMVDKNWGTEVAYTVTMEPIPDLGVMQTNQTTTFILGPESETIQWLTFNATGSLNAYNVSTAMNKSVTISFTCYNSEGLEVYDICSSANDTSHIVLLDPGLYYIAISHYTTGAVKVWATATPLSLDVVKPGDSVTVNSTDIKFAYYQLSLTQGYYYSMNLVPTSDVDAFFGVCEGPTTAVYKMAVADQWSSGQAENLTDFIIVGTTVFYNTWDQNLTGGWDLTQLKSNMYWEGQMADASRLVLIIGLCGEGNATFSLSNGTPAASLTPGSSVVVSLNNTVGPLWTVIRITDLTPATGYKLSIAHSGVSGGQLSTDYMIFQSICEMNTMLLNVKPLYSSSIWNYLTNIMTPQSEDYDSYAYNTTQEEYLFTSAALDEYLVIAVPDAVEDGYYSGTDLLAGTVNITLAPLTKTTLTVGSPITVLPNSEYPLFFTMSLTPDHFYQISVTATNASSGLRILTKSLFSSITIPTIYNGSGYPLQAYTKYGLLTSPDPSDYNTVYMSFQAKGTTSDFTLMLPTYGDGPLTIELTDITPTSIFSSPMLLLTAAGAATAAGIFIGFLIGKAKYV